VRLRELAIVCGLGLPMSAFAMSFVDRDVSSMLEESKAVVEGTVVGIKAGCDKFACFSNVTVTVEKTYKGDATATEARFCSSAPLSIGFSYIFFVETAQRQADRRQCRTVVAQDAIFSRFGNAVYRYMSPGSFNTAKIADDEYITGWILVKGFDATLIKD
jgi:hypothetical protein